MKKKKIRKDIKRAHKGLRQAVIDLFTRSGNKEMNYKQVSAALDVQDEFTRHLVAEILDQLAREGKLKETEPGKFQSREIRSLVEGRIEITASGSGYLIVEGLPQDIQIPSRYTGGAFHNDIVRASLFAQKPGKRLEGEVVEVIQRSREEFVGVLEISEGFAFLVPDNEKIRLDIFIPGNKIHGAENGMKAIVKVTEWRADGKNPVGEVIKVLGKPGENETEMHAILAEFGLTPEFPVDVEKAAEEIPFEIPAEEIAKRRDFRKITTFTIDPVDAKDFDDALSLRKLENGNWEIGIHIADVSHYVQPQGIIDKEAYRRATSVYLVDRVVPMLPEKLSNGVCSLRPQEEKLTFSVVVEMNEKAEVLNEWIGRTVIFSDQRFAYEDAQKIIETGQGAFQEEVLQLHKLASVMRKERFANGALRVEQQEVKFRLNEKGEPIEVYHKESKEANWLIEEFMLLANKKVAEYAGKKTSPQKQLKTFVYRVHDTPDLERLKEFKKFIANFGYKLDLNTPKNIAASLNNVLKECKDKPEGNMIETLAIRSMAKAVYTTRNVGHYGLAFDFYSHFTSPIRRYPDLMVHRLLESYLAGGPSADEKKLEPQCKHSSEMEKKAADAERASIKYKQVEYMIQFVGKEFMGVISGVTEWGIYVELDENKCEGMVRLRDIDDDFYSFDEKNYAVVGNRSKKTYRLGDAVKIRVMKADLERRQLDFKLIAK